MNSSKKCFIHVRGVGSSDAACSFFSCVYKAKSKNDFSGQEMASLSGLFIFRETLMFKRFLGERNMRSEPVQHSSIWKPKKATNKMPN